MGLTAEDIGAVLSLILLRGEQVVPTRRSEVYRALTDNVVSEAAITGQAYGIVGGDEDWFLPEPIRGNPNPVPRILPPHVAGGTSKVGSRCHSGSPPCRQKGSGGSGGR
jgi:hypothetical protein